MSVYGNNPGPYTSRAIASEADRMMLACERLGIIATEQGASPEVAWKLAEWVRNDLAVWLRIAGQHDRQESRHPQ